jgi:hypothetical protein
MRPAQNHVAEGCYHDICPEQTPQKGHIESGKGEYGHEHDKMAFIIEANTLVYPCDD